MKGRQAGESHSFGEMEIIEALPHSSFRPEGGEDVLRAMRGAEIVKIGSVDDDGLEGGGLLIDYIPRGSDCIRRVVFAFNELGLWIEGEAERQLLDEL